MIRKEDRTSDAVDRDELAREFQLHEIREKIERLQPDSILVIDPHDPSWVDLYNKHNTEFKELVMEAIFEIKKNMKGILPKFTFKGVKIQLNNKPDMLLHDIGPSNTNKPLTFDCTVIAIDARKTFIKEGVYKCPRCDAQETIKCDKDRRIHSFATKCKTPRCKKEQMIIETSMSKTEYIQTAIIQEPLEEAKNNSPVTFVAKLVGPDVGEAFISQKKRITGVFKTFMDSKKIEQDVYIDVIEMKDLAEKELVLPSQLMIDDYRIRAKTPEWIDSLIKSYAPHIYGYRNIKLSILLMLAGGVKTNKRSEINILLVGDPSMAKTELLKYGEKVTQKSAYTTGKGASGVGLTIAIIKEENLGRFMATAGVYPLCNGGYVFVDEFDKMNKEDRSAMHEVLEHGVCSVAKAGINLTLQAKCATLAAANPKYGKYDPDLTLNENIDLMPTLLSRMDMIWLIRDKINDLEDSRKAEYVLQEFETVGKPYESAFSSNELLSLLNYVKGLKPLLCKDARDKLLSMYKQMRKSVDKHDMTPVGIRQLEALVRLSMAHAKIRLRTEVMVDDVDAVIALFKESFLSYGVDIEHGVQRTLDDPEKMDKENAFWHAWNEVKVGEDVDLVILTEHLAGTPKFKTDSDVGKYVTSMEHALKILRQGDGRWKKA